MKILLINNFLGKYGGAEESNYRTGIILREKGHEVYFFATNKQPFFEPDYVYSKYFPEYINYNAMSKIKSFKHLFRPFYNYEAQKKLDLYLKEIKPDIVHCNNIYYHLTPAVLKACYDNKIPVVMTLRDPRLMCPSGTLLLEGKEYCKDELCVSKNPLFCVLNKCKNRNLTASIVVTGEYIFNKAHKLFDRVSHFICPSQAILDLGARSGISRDKLFLVNNFLPDSFLDIQPEYSNKGYFLYIGRLTVEKGLDSLLKAMSSLPEIKLHVVGEGPERENLEKLANSLNLSNVEFLGHKKGEELQQEYKNCIATVLPSIWFEVFGLTNIESFIYGKPVIASAVGGIPEVVNDNKEGILYTPGNTEELTAAIKKLYYDNNLAVEMGKNGNNKVRELYTSEVYYSKLIEIYNKALTVV